VKSKLVLGVVFGLISGLASAQTNSESQAYFECGNVACASNVDPYGPVTTGINNLNVGGDLFNVTFTSTQPAVSPFVLSTTTAAPGQPLTGIDAGLALTAFYGAQKATAPGNYFTIFAGDPGPAFVTAFAPAGSLASQFQYDPNNPVLEVADVAQTVLAASFGQVAEEGYFSSSIHWHLINGPLPNYTTWTAVAAPAPVAAPEVDPTCAGSGLAFLIGGLAALLGRRRPHLLEG